MGKMNLKRILIYLAVGIVAIAVISSLSGGGRANSTIPLSNVVELVQDNQVSKIVVQHDDLVVFTKSGQVYRSKKESGMSIYEAFDAAGVNVNPSDFELEVKGATGLGSFFGGLLSFLPLIFFGAILFFMFRQAQGMGNQTMWFGKSKARVIGANRPTVTFEDVAGVEEAKGELQEVVEFLKFPERFTALGAKIPKGVLLVGPPGTGKTLLSRAVAGEANVPFYLISGSEFVEMFVGVGAARVRDLFGQAKREAPSIVFVDEIDAVGRQRGAGLGGGHDEREQTLNQILVEMDGFDTGSNVIVIAATNRPDVLDPALLRPGRFDRRVVLDNPDINGRIGILEVHIKGKPLDHTVDLEFIAKQTPGFSGADLANLVNEAAILAARKGKKAVGAAEFTEAVDRVIAGPERKSRVIGLKEKQITAYHEAGHALVAYTLPDADIVGKVSIVARGSMGGYTRLMPDEDRYLYSKSQFLGMLATALGGRIAEEIQFDELTTGASNDLEQATKIARQMVTRYGMTKWSKYEEVPITTLVEGIDQGKVESIEIYGNDLLFTMKSRRGQEKPVYRSRKEDDFSMIDYLSSHHARSGKNGVKLVVQEPRKLDGLGPRTFGKREELVFLGKEMSEQRDYGNTVADQIDLEVMALIESSYHTARNVLLENQAKLNQIASYLIEHETVEGEELNTLFASEVLE